MSDIRFENITPILWGIFSLSWWCISFSWNAKVVNFDEEQLLCFFFWHCTFGVVCKNPFCNPRPWRFTPMFYSFHLYIFISDPFCIKFYLKQRSNFIHFHVDVQLDIPVPFVEKTVLSTLNFHGTLSIHLITNMSLFLDSKFYCIDLYLYPYAIITESWWLHLCIKFWN